MTRKRESLKRKSRRECKKKEKNRVEREIEWKMKVQKRMER